MVLVLVCRALTKARERQKHAGDRLHEVNTKLAGKEQNLQSLKKGIQSLQGQLVDELAGNGRQNHAEIRPNGR